MHIRSLMGVHRSVACFLPLLAASVGAQIQIEPGVALQVVPFSSTRGFPAFPPAGDPNFPAHVYSTGPAGQQLVAYDASGVATVLGSLQLDFGVLQFGRGATSGRLFAVECCLTTIAPDGVYAVSAAGAVAPFNLLGGGNPDPNDIEFPGGAFGDFVYAANPSSGSATATFNQSITRLSTSGPFVDVFHQDSRGPFFMAASSGGAYGEYIYCSYLYSSAVDRIDPSGTATPFADLGADGHKLAFGLGGAFGTDLYAGTQSGELYRIDPNGVRTLIATDFQGNSFAFDPASGDMLALQTTPGGPLVRITSSPTASCTFRNGSGINPTGFDCTSNPVLGTNWDSTIATIGSTTSTFLGLGGTPGQFQLLGGEFLIGVAPQPVFLPGLGSHSVPIPNAAVLMGAPLFSQGLRIDAPVGVPTLVLLNAQDLVLGI